MTYGDGRWLHLYLTLKNTETETIRGDQRLALEELYAVLLHTGSTHTGFEFSIFPWGDRDFANNLAPHGWFAAKFRAALRNMLVREQGDELHLLSAISPEWIRPGQSIIVKRAPTDFGEVNFNLKSDGRGATIVFDNHLNAASRHSQASPRALILHLPWFVRTTEVIADGVRLSVNHDAVILPIATQRVCLIWTKRPNIPEMSYAKTVEQYKADYRRHYDEWQSTGRPSR